MKKVIYVGSFRQQDREKEELTPQDWARIRDEFAAFSENKSLEPVVFCIGNCRGGGDLAEVLDFVEKLDTHPVPSVALVIGKACSTAALLAIGCMTRVASADACFIFHPIRMRIDISVARLESGGRLPRKVLREIGRLNRRMAAFLETRTNISPARIKAILSRREGNAEYGAADALEVHIVDDVFPASKLN